MEVLMALMVLPVVFILGVVLTAVPLYFTVKFFNVEGSLFTALKVTVLAWLGSLVVGSLLGVLGMVIPVLPWLLSVVAPFALYTLLVQHFYNLELVSALIVSAIQTVVSFILVAVAVFAVVIPFGIIGLAAFT